LHKTFLTCLAAAVFALNLSCACAQNQTIDDGCGANVGTVTHSNVVLNINCKNARKSPLSIQYVRLFGGVEVPLLMALFGQPEISSDSPWAPKFRTVKKHGEEIEQVHVKLIKFFNFYTFKDASPLLTNIWSDVAAKFDAAGEIAWRATAGSRKERICFFTTQHADESGYDSELLMDNRLIRSEAQCKSTVDSFNRRVGFTFLLFTNDSDEVLTDVHFHFRSNYDSNRLTGIWQDLPDYLKSGGLKEVPENGSPISNMKAIYGSATDIELKVNGLQPDDIFAARIEPKQKLIALLNIYIAGENRLPATYLSGIYLFDEVTYKTGEVLTTLKVRAPYLTRAARVMVPYGWASQ
jgi:hypothetical protein